jgi:hypothetical protein
LRGAKKGNCHLTICYGQSAKVISPPPLSTALKVILWHVLNLRSAKSLSNAHPLSE